MAELKTLHAAANTSSSSSSMSLWPCTLYEAAEGEDGRPRYLLVSAPDEWQKRVASTWPECTIASWPDTWAHCPHDDKRSSSIPSTVALEATLAISPAPRSADMVRLYLFRNALLRLLASVSDRLASLTITLDYGEACQQQQEEEEEYACLLAAGTLPKYLLTNEQAMTFLRIPQLFKAFSGSETPIRMYERCRAHPPSPPLQD